MPILLGVGIGGASSAADARRWIGFAILCSTNQCALVGERPGTYAIKVEVEGAGGKDTLEMADFIQVLEKVPVRAAFSASPRRAKIGEEVLFALDSATGVTSVRWDFADGTSATNSVARHTYSRAGTFIVKVAAEGPDGADSSQLAEGVEVFSELPVDASFSVSPRRAKVNEDLLFTLDSAAGATSTRWDFGDGITASNSLARHSYAKVGDYDIGVEVSGPGGKDAATNKGYVQIRAEVPLEPVFSWAPKSLTAGQEVQFIDESVGGPTKWLWEIPGIGIRSERSPLIVFAKPEKVLVRLTVERDGQRRSIEKEITIQPPPPPLLQARFEVAPTNGRSPLMVQFTDRSAGVVAKYSWDFGDGQRSDLRNPTHEYKLQGMAQSFQPRLAIADSTGQEAKDSGGVVISVVPPPPWWIWPLVGGLAVLGAGYWGWKKWIWNTPPVGRLKWQEQGQTRERQLEGKEVSFDLAQLHFKSIPPGKYILRNIRRTGPFLIQEGREPQRLEHQQQFEAEGIKFTYLEY